MRKTRIGQISLKIDPYSVINPNGSVIIVFTEDIMVNYYELLGIPQDADNAAVKAAIKKTRKLWNNRANSPDASIRAEAERHVKEIAEAEKILLDSAERESYNRKLAQSPKDNGNDQNQNSAPVDWERDYWQAYNNKLADAAAQIAKKAASVNEHDGRAWFLYGEALRYGGNYEAAIAPLQRASLLLPKDAGVYRQLGFSYLDSGHDVEAMDAFSKAEYYDPQNGEFPSIKAMLYRKVNMIDAALAEAKLAFKLSPNDDDVRFEYFFALYEDAMRSMSYNRSSGKHLIINKVQLDYVNDLLKEMALTIPKDENKSRCTARMDEIVKCVVDAESKKGGFLSSKIGYQYNYSISNADTRATGKH